MTSSVPLHEPASGRPPHSEGQRSTAKVAVICLLVGAVLFVGLQLLAAQHYKRSAGASAASTARIVSAVIDDLDVTPEEANDDFPALNAAYLARVARPGATRPPENTYVGVFETATSERGIELLYACAEPTDAKLPPWLTAPRMCVPLSDPDADPVEVDTGGVFRTFGDQ